MQRIAHMFHVPVVRMASLISSRFCFCLRCGHCRFLILLHMLNFVHSTVMLQWVSIFELTHTRTLHDVFSAPFVESGAQFLFRCRSRDVEINSECPTLYSASLDDAFSNQPRRVVGLARTLQSWGTRVRTYGMAVQEGVLAERNRFADFEIALY